MIPKKIILTPIILLLIVYNYVYYYHGPGRYKEGRIVQTRSGKVKGSMDLSRDGREFYQWLGVPYAEPPVGDLRFASPKPIKNWQDTLDTSRYGPVCPQMQMGVKIIIGDEDCLHSNIYVPKIKIPKEGLPVMVFIHGGGFVMGSAVDYSPDYFMDEDVLLILINYRFGIMGFLTTGDHEIRGNMGLKDQAEALRWINANVEFFGGNPNNILVFGESAGGASTHYMTLSPKTRGLFHKAVSMSGTALSPWAYWPIEKGVEKTKILASNLNCPISNSREMTQCLRKLDFSELIQVFKNDVSTLSIYNPSRDSSHLPPTLEVIDDDEAFLTQPPGDILREGKAHQIPWMTGVLKDEGLVTSWEFIRDEKAMEIVDNNWSKSARSVFFRNLDSPQRAEDVCEKLREFYFPSSSLTEKGMSFDQKFDQYTQMYSDGLFLVGASVAASIQRKFAPVYLYFYERHGGPEEFGTVMSDLRRNTELGPWLEFLGFGIHFVIRKYILGLPGRDFGVAHAQDLQLMFPIMGILNVAKNEEDPDYIFSKDLIKFFVSFAKDENSVEYRGTKLLPVDSEGPLTYLNINEVGSIVPEPFEERTNFWRSIGYPQLFFANNQTMVS